MKQQRVLIFGMTDNPGGAESYVMSIYRSIDREKISFGFLCNTDVIAYEEEFREYGGKVYYIPMRRKHPLRFCRELDRFMKEHAHEYDAIWVNVSSLANIDYLVYAQRSGIQRRIIHSHNVRNTDSALRGILHRINKEHIAEYATDFWACSEAAADWFYQGAARNKAVILPNSVDPERFLFDQAGRDRIRREYHWQDKQIIGNIGRLHFQKNQAFAVEVFSAYHRTDPGSVLVLVGQGEEERSLRNEAERLGLSGCVVFAGVQDSIQDWLSAFDLFLFPSRFEGMSVALIEAQANGVPVLASTEAMEEAHRFNDNVVRLPLEEPAQKWAEMIPGLIGRRTTAGGAIVPYNTEACIAQFNDMFGKNDP